MLVGGALAGLAGVIHFAGVEHQLRPGMTTNIGYIGFLASWFVRHRPLAVLAACFAFAGLTVAGDSLQIDAGLPAATSSILTGLVLVAVLGWTSQKAKS
jgi:simple sugar transport system permease protein